MRPRPKHVDVDKPDGWIKRKLRRWRRRVDKREALRTVREELESPKEA